MKIPSILGLGALLIAGLPAVAADFAATRVGTPSAAAPAGWRTLSVPGKPETQFSAASARTIKVTAQDSAGFLYRKVVAREPGHRQLTWRWRVDMAPPPTDQSMPGMDDRPLAVHVWFDGEPGADSSWTPLDRVGAWLFDVPLPGKVLTYVWGGTGRRGDSLVNPHLRKDGRIIILRPGATPTGRWFGESVDIDADFRRVFGTPAPPPRFVAISGDTDDKRGVSMGSIAGLGFQARP
ncbi:MAG: DUF3047 domain-containing protein [Alphaproteobacteria bacterium]|nr:DUF3047 domain-containing protein [Alphaproteobacteria bacterium]